MMNDEDLFNVLVGIIVVLEKNVLVVVCVWGFLLVVFLWFLGWMYFCEGGMLKRRSVFLSWLWVGWEGEVLFNEVL